MGKKILIVDDDQDFAEAITILLEARGYEILHAPNGAEGIVRAQTDNPDLILLDVMMTTKTEGFDVSRKLRDDATTTAIPVIMVTGIRREMNLAFAPEPNSDWLPVKAVMEKPVKPEKLLALVEEHIRK